MMLALSGLARADEAHKLVVQLEWLPDGHHAPIFLAQDKGWFAKAGLDVTLLEGRGSALAVQLVGAGQFDVGEADLSSMVVARAKGVSLMSVAAVFRRGDIGLLVPADSPIHTIKDLAGKSIIYTAGSFEGPFMDVFLATGGQSRETVHLLNVDAAAKTPLFFEHKGDGMMTTGTTMLPIVANKLPSRIISFADVGLDLPGYGLFARPTELAEKGDAIRKFASIVEGAWTYVVAGHEDEAVDATLHQRPDAKLDRAIVAGQLKLDLPYLTSPATKGMPLGFQSDADWVSFIKLFEKINMIPPGSKPSDYYTNDYLDAATIKSVGAGKG